MSGAAAGASAFPGNFRKQWISIISISSPPRFPDLRVIELTAPTGERLASG